MKRFISLKRFYGSDKILKPCLIFHGFSRPSWYAGKDFFPHQSSGTRNSHHSLRRGLFIFSFFFVAALLVSFTTVLPVLYSKFSNKKIKGKDGLGGNAMRLMRLRFAGQTNRPSVGEATKREREKGLHRNNRLMVRFVHRFPIPGQFYLYSQREQLF